jgi:hypothetical protein
MIVITALSVFALSLPISGSPPFYPRDDNDGIHLALSPACGSATGGVAVDRNNGIPALSQIKTIVTFGVRMDLTSSISYLICIKDSFTSVGKNDGSAPDPPILSGNSPDAGGRITNGLTWIEDLAADSNATLMDYAVAGAVVNVTLWPSKSTASDFLNQTNIFLGQNNSFDPETTLYTSFFGINDYTASQKDGNHLPEAADDYVALVNKLAGPPTNAKYWLALDDYGRGTDDLAGDAYKNAVFSGIAETNLTWAFVDFKTLWNGVLTGPPGYAAFGYNSPGACTVNSSSAQGACSDPEHTFYWIPGHPSKETHRIMADYIEAVLQQCV